MFRSATALILLLLIPIILWLLPANFFDNGAFIVCISRRWFGIECLGCGMTRAVMHFHHFEFKAAFAFNRGVILFYPFLVGLWFYCIKTTRKGGLKKNQPSELNSEG